MTTITRGPPSAGYDDALHPLGSGRTGETVFAIGLGGWHLALPYVDEALSFRIVPSGMDRGITFTDNSWDHNDGKSELRMGKALRDGYRERVFLMTKIDGRSASRTPPHPR